MNRFCTRCGSPLDAAGRCPACDPPASVAGFAPGGATAFAPASDFSESSGGAPAAVFPPPAAPPAAAGGLRMSRSLKNGAPPASPAAYPGAAPLYPTATRSGSVSAAPQTGCPGAVPAYPTAARPEARPAAAAAPGKAERLRNAAPGGAPVKKPAPALKAALLGGGLLLTAVLVVTLLQLFGAIRLPFLGGGSDDAALRDDGPRVIPEDTLERPDPVEYLTQTGRIVKSTDAAAATLLTEEEACRSFRERGFTAAPVVAVYAEDGTCQEAAPVDEHGTARHPYYQAYYQTPNGDLWSVAVINGVFVAEPITYNDTGSWTVPHLVSENARIQEYDGASNTFFEIDPDPAKLVVKVVSDVDALTLDNLDEWEVDQP